ncbi:MAG: phosphoribosylformylglycinamidine synthase subunit PurQ [Deltaproteobacteria bacterium]|nr:phosphoribosylformylglycinamidine synthase subunit PurQ [Deltaproteobacteria bacterium]
MASKVKALVVTGNGVNCEMETAHACRLAGAKVDIVTVYDLMAGRTRLDDYQFLNLAGGFLDGDDLGSAKAGANRWAHAKTLDRGERLLDQLKRFIEADKLVMGVCNGFQLLVKLGILPGLENRIGQTVTLTYNDSGRFEDRWVHLLCDPKSPCIFTRDLGPGIFLPIRHGEGKLVTSGNDVLEQIEQQHLAPLKYSTSDYSKPAMEYPENPNGSQNSIAGMCDSSGRILGLMPHPEAYTHKTNHPRWTRMPDLPKEGMGLKLFRNAVAWLDQA